MIEGLIPWGEVDERSIVDVQPEDLKGYTQCHFFAGIGGWAYALQLAGWGDRPVWTGSCPCQPFSAAGKQKGKKDERHLWPEFFRLIAECRPATVFGEQVASKLGREWLAGVFADLEGVGCAVAGADLCAASIGAPHIRQRLWWVADSDSKRRTGEYALLRAEKTRWLEGEISEAAGCSKSSGRLGNADDAGSQGRGVLPERADELPAGEASLDCWGQAIWLPCADGKARRIKPGIEPLAHGIPGRVAQLRGLGNAIVPQVAAAFVQAYLDVE